MRVRVGCELSYVSSYPTPLLLLLAARQESRYHRLVEETPPHSAFHTFTDLYGNRAWRAVAGPESLTIQHDAVVEVPHTPDLIFPGLAKVPVAELPDEVLLYTLPSRYCPLEPFMDDAWKLFGRVRSGWEQVQAVCDWLHEKVRYRLSSTASTTAHDAYLKREGVCRDFAHMAIAFCRALNIPARYVSGYLPDIGVPDDGRPMDFHAWFEAFVGGAWHTFDARHNRPRTGRVLVAYGRDAVDTAFSTAYGGARLASMRVWADEVEGNFRLPSLDAAA